MHVTKESTLPTINSQKNHLSTFKGTNIYRRGRCKKRKEDPKKLTAHDEQSRWELLSEI